MPATILDAAGVSPWRVLDGRSLLDLAADPGEEWGRGILIENGRGANGIPTYRGIRTYRYLYVEHLSTGEYELYDLVEDPSSCSRGTGPTATARCSATSRGGCAAPLRRSDLPRRTAIAARALGRAAGAACATTCACAWAGPSAMRS